MVTHKGKSTVDYFLTRHQDLEHIVSFNVLNVYDFILDQRLMGLMENKVSDHSILCCTIQQGELLDNTNNEDVTDISRSPCNNAPKAALDVIGEF